MTNLATISIVISIISIVISIQNLNLIKGVQENIDGNVKNIRNLLDLIKKDECFSEKR